MNRAEALKLIDQLTNENTDLRKLLEEKSYTYDQRLIIKIYASSKAILLLLQNDCTVTRALCYEMGISERQYYWALAFLRYAGILHRNGKRLRVKNINESARLAQFAYDKLMIIHKPLRHLRVFNTKK